MSASLQDICRWSPFVYQVMNRYSQMDWDQWWDQPTPAEGWVLALENAVKDIRDMEVLMKKVRQLRHWHQARLAVQELRGDWSEHQVIKQISHVAEGLIRGAYAAQHAMFAERYGEPTNSQGEPIQMLILAMGKLGGEELNFSSDIDLIYIYPEEGMTQGGRKSVENSVFFDKLAKALTRTLAEITADGFAYRVDLRLRPFGSSGPMVQTLDALEHYFAVYGRPWERYAMVKMRALTGSAADVDYLYQLTRGFVYRRYVDFSMMQELRTLKQAIAAQLPEHLDNIKLGVGGIRESEFFVQVFQIIYGGRFAALQSRSLHKAYAALVLLKFISQEEHDHHLEAYHFFRRVENRLQAYKDEQTQILPLDKPQQLLGLAESFGLDVDGFLTQLNHHRQWVQNAFEHLLKWQEDKQPQESSPVQDWAQWLGSESWQLLEGAFVAHKIARPGDVVAFLQDFLDGKRISRLDEISRQRLYQFTAELLFALSQQSQYAPLAVLQRVERLVLSVVRRSSYLVMLTENQGALQRWILLTMESQWITDQLEALPALLETLVMPGPIPKGLADLQSQLNAQLAQVDDEESRMEVLRHFKRSQVFRIAMADLLGDLQVMKISDYLSWIAEAILQAAHDQAWLDMHQRYGIPPGHTAEDSPVLIIGMGKLGGLELSYGSDLDLVYIYDEDDPNVQLGKISIGQFYNRMGQRLNHWLTTRTYSGMAYEIDTRLRPNGGGGLLMSTLSGFFEYEHHKAWTWEHQALVRARVIVGQEPYRQAFEAGRIQLLTTPRDGQKLLDDVVSMRQKMRDHLDKSNDQLFDLKQGPGGMVDIEFMVQYGVLLHAPQYPQVAKWSDNYRIMETLVAEGLWPQQQFDELWGAYSHYRIRAARLQLQGQKALDSWNDHQAWCEKVQFWWKNTLQTL